jgi:hypothetical protein
MVDFGTALIFFGYFFSSRKKSDENHKRSETLKLLAETKPENCTWQFFSEPLLMIGIKYQYMVKICTQGPTPPSSLA